MVAKKADIVLLQKLGIAAESTRCPQADNWIKRSPVTDSLLWALCKAHA